MDKKIVKKGGSIALVVCFVLMQCASHPKHQDGNMPPPPPPVKIGINAPPETEMPPMIQPEGEQPPPPGPRPMGIGMFDITLLSLLIFLLGTNVGVKFYFKSESDALRMLDIEHANLKQELEYLKYQVNPHFFMNTLNNIHALVDIDPEQAKTSIVELSHMMRYVLYDGAQSDIALDKGIIFLKNYIAIMRLRYSDNVDIKVSMPEHVPQVEVPPLITIPFVENAFKHGVSYVKPSFIHISLDIDSENGNVVFSCRNSKHLEKAQIHNDKQGGVGLTNVTKRLNLLYGDNYTLDIDNADNIFSVRLILPFKTNNQNTKR